jgi:hypothetical protein
MKSIVLKKAYALGVLLEAILFLYLYNMESDINEVFRYAARYSGRLSLGIYLLCFFLFRSAYLNDKSLKITQKVLGVFAVMHVIHFFFLAYSIYLNQVPIVPTRLAGGFVAYLMIVIYPFLIEKINRKAIHLTYFYYVGFVMIMTYISRVSRQFIGAEPEIFHFIALGFLIFILLIFGTQMVLKKSPIITKKN